ncbi:MAG: methionine aminotransferase, partial [Gemmatimonadetes bacterium]
STISELPDDEFSLWLTKEIGVAPVPGSSFFSRAEPGRRLVRFAFCKTEEMLAEAARRLARVRRPAHQVRA